MIEINKGTTKITLSDNEDWKVVEFTPIESPTGWYEADIEGKTVYGDTMEEIVNEVAPELSPMIEKDGRPRFEVYYTRYLCDEEKEELQKAVDGYSDEQRRSER